MIKRVLVCTDGSQYSETACAYAIHLAKRLQADLTGVHVLDSRLLEGPLLSDISGWIGAQPYGNQLQQFRDILEHKGRAVIDAFNETCAAAGVNSEGILRMGHPARALLDEEDNADILVLGQRGVHVDIIGDGMGSVIERVVRHSAKPCLVTPATFRETNNIMLAYDGSEHAKHALQYAIFLSKTLDLELIIMTVADDKDEAMAERVSEEAMQVAETQDCRAISLVCEGRRSAHVILDVVDEQGADLLIMGAYGHSRIRELVLGSTTHHVITHAAIPVLLVR